MNDEVERAYHYGVKQGVEQYQHRVIDKLTQYRQTLWDDNQIMLITWEQMTTILREATHE